MRPLRLTLTAHALTIGLNTACATSNCTPKSTSPAVGSESTGAQSPIPSGSTRPNRGSVSALPNPADSQVTHPTAPDRSTVAVSPGARGEPGVWEQVTPPGMSMDPGFRSNSNFGARELFVDPANPNVLYLTATHQGMWKSTDYGLTFKKVSADGGPLDQGAAWAVGIDPNPKRDPKTPPVLYSATGYGPQQGFWRSDDDGRTWTHFSLGKDNDFGSIAVDPKDKNHVIVGMRASTHVLESKDGGKTWRDLGAVGVRPSNHVFFVTSDIWLLVSEWGDGSAGTRRTTDGGSTWAKVSTCERFHGSSQPYIGSNGLIFAPCVDQILKSTDYGATWKKVGDGPSSAVVATSTYYYVATGWATQGAWDPNPRRAKVADGGVDWAKYTTVPAAMTNGPHRAAVTFDGTKHVVLSSNWLGGVWRYVEP